MWASHRHDPAHFAHAGLNTRAARSTFDRVVGLDTSWGGSIRMNLGFAGRGRLLPGVRNLVVDMCTEYLASGDTTQQLVTAVQELLENLVKYSEAGAAAAIDFELLLLGGQPIARIGTQNRASRTHLAEARTMLDRIIAAPDPEALFQSLIDSSGERKGSGLGLVRLRAEAGLVLSYEVERSTLSIEARRAVQARGSLE